MATPRRIDIEARAQEMEKRLEKCWSHDIDWTLYPHDLQEVDMSSVLSLCIHAIIGI